MMEIELLGGGAARDGRQGMLSFAGSLRVFLALEPCDTGKGCDGALWHGRNQAR